MFLFCFQYTLMTKHCRWKPVGKKTEFSMKSRSLSPCYYTRAHFYTLLSGVSCVLRSFIPGQQKKTARRRMFRHFVPSRELHSLAPLKRLSLVDLPSANSIKCCSPPASLKNRIPKIRPLTGRNVRKVDGLFLSPKSKKEVKHKDKTENP